MMVGIGEEMDFQPSSLPGRPAPGPDQRRSGFFESEGLARTFFSGRASWPRGLATRDSQNYGHNSPRLLVLASSTY